MVTSLEDEQHFTGLEMAAQLMNMWDRECLSMPEWLRILVRRLFAADGVPELDADDVGLNPDYRRTLVDGCPGGMEGRSAWDH